ncbi:neuronal acetylcholine receptor subunit alpha-10 isoform X2 [Lontra canadensis]|uniref:neuronal acetylcholine receptor subunit alpha-10 isoform X2 n=1 Tax=Lontra canadensis TaxID=76717 RepID=UPI0013F30D69|nr:neuronal acetylcholine receptor subunit alpha-10 isoform X2 [Lontra canadensis]
MLPSVGSQDSHLGTRPKSCCGRSMGPRSHHFSLVFSVSSLGLLFLFSLFPECLGAEGKLAHKLFRDLFANYTSALRPVADTDQTLNVTLEVTLSQIIDMDERNQVLTLYLWIRQEWTDAYLRWDPNAYGGLDAIRIPSSLVWRPDIVLYNKADTQPPASASTNVVLRHDGAVRWDAPAITRSSCRVDVSAFPFDAQRCGLTFGSWTHGGHQLDVRPRGTAASLADFVENVEWRVLGMPARRRVLTYGCCSEPYPDVTFTLLLRRRAAAYVCNLLLPCVLISLLAPLAFHLPADSGEKVSLGVTVLLALTVFQLLLAESMPPAESVPLIERHHDTSMREVLHGHHDHGHILHSAHHPYHEPALLWSQRPTSASLGSGPPAGTPGTRPVRAGTRGALWAV